LSPCALPPHERANLSCDLPYFPRRDEFARLLDELTLLRQEQQQRFTRQGEEMEQRFALLREEMNQRFEQLAG